MEYHWGDVRDKAIAGFKETPGGELEAEVLEQFRERPTTVVTMVDKIISDIKRGKDIRSGWAVLRAQLRRGVHENVVVTDTDDKDRAVRAAHHWIINAGLYCETADDVLSELFDYGLLARWRSDTSLQAEMAEHWKQVRPRGQEAEIASLAYQNGCRPKLPVRSVSGGRGTADSEDRDPSPVNA